MLTTHHSYHSISTVTLTQLSHYYCHPIIAVTYHSHIWQIYLKCLMKSSLRLQNPLGHATRFSCITCWVSYPYCVTWRISPWIHISATLSGRSEADISDAIFSWTPVLHLSSLPTDVCSRCGARSSSSVMWGKPLSCQL